MNRINNKDFLLIAVAIFVTTIAWMISELYLIHKNTPSEKEIQSITIDYSIDEKVIQTLQNKTP